jgi:lysophospholipase L1-like esterase
MTSLSASSSSAVIPLDAWGTITVSANNGGGTLRFVSDAKNLCSDFSANLQSKTYGPYGAPGTVTLSVTSGRIDYTVSLAAGAGGSVAYDTTTGRVMSNGTKLSFTPKQTSIATKCFAAFPIVQAGSHGVNRNTHVELTTEVDFDSVRIILFSTQTSTQTGIAASLGVSATTIGTTLAAMNAFAPSATVDVTWAAASSVTQAAGTATAPSITVSDWMDISSIPRTDGGLFPLLHVRVYQPSANANISYRGSASDQAWRNTVSDGRTVQFYYKDATDITTGMPTWTSGAAVAPRLVPFAIQYRARGQIRTLGVIGDSISYGQGATNYGEGYTTLLHRALSISGRRVEFANFGWPGQTTTTFYNLFQSLVTAGILPAGYQLVHGFSPNDTSGTGTDLSASIIATARTQISKMIDTITTNGCVPYVANAMPENTAAKGWATDSLRTAFNTALAAYPDTNIVDLSAPMSGNTTGGQVQILGGLANADNLHPSDAGYAAIFAAINQLMFR